MTGRKEEVGAPLILLAKSRGWGLYLLPPEHRLLPVRYVVNVDPAKLFFSVLRFLVPEGPHGAGVPHATQAISILGPRGCVLGEWGNSD